MRAIWTQWSVGGALLVAALVGVEGALAQIVEDVPPELEGVGITENLNAPLPLDLTFQDEDGNTVALGSYFENGKPVILNLVYFSCPMLCNVFLDGFVSGLTDLDWTPGDEFEIITVSIDPEDTPAGATAKRRHYVDKLDRPRAQAGWHFLTGEAKNTRRLADVIGFGYRYNEETREYMHSAGLFLCTPDGRLSRYFYGVMFDPQTLRLSLVEASDGKIGTTLDRVLLFCFAYDHTEGRYGPAAMNLMRAFAAICVAVLGVFLAAGWQRDLRRKRSLPMGARS
jgi:protein SCO1/2